MYIGSKHILKKFSNTLPSTINLNTDSISSTDNHKNLGIIFDNNLNFDLHHQNIIKSCYNTLYHLNSLKYNIPTKQKSTLIKSLIISKLHYADLVTFPLNTYWHKKYFKVIKTSLSFIHNKYISTSDIHNYNFLSPNNVFNLNLICAAYKSLYSICSPLNLQLNLVEPGSYALRSQDAPRIKYEDQDLKTYTTQAATAFNKLPAHIRTIHGIHNFHRYKRTVKKFIIDNC